MDFEFNIGVENGWTESPSIKRKHISYLYFGKLVHFHFVLNTFFFLSCRILFSTLTFQFQFLILSEPLKDMDSIPRKRPKSETKTPKRNPKSHHSPIRSLLEPPQSFFPSPSKEESIKLLTVLLVACAVAFTCSFLAKHLDSDPKPFCDSDSDSTDSDLGKLQIH